jgi:toxin ParE1/3/4
VKPVIFTPQARRDLADIADYIAVDNPRRAVTFIEELEERCIALGKAPEAPRRFPQLDADAHILPYRNYVILYRDLPTEVSITRIIHAARDILALVAPGD